jgi:perosamine synthetase
LETLTKDILKGLEVVLGPPETTVPLHAPEFRGEEWDNLKECLDSTFVSSVGKFVDQFEQDLALYTGSRHAIAVANGTAALHVALILAGVKPGDEVLVPALSFVATANAVSHAGAIPHFVDSNIHTMGLDPAALEGYLENLCERTSSGLRNKSTGNRIAAVVPMHAYGHAVEMNHLLSVAERFGLPIVEDAAEALGSLYRGKHLGTFGQTGILSFNGNKIITTGGGGAILTDCPELARRAKQLTTTAKRPHPWAFYHEEVAWNYRMPNLNAALGCAQLKQLPGFLIRKRELASRYMTVFDEISGVTYMKESSNSTSNYWLNTVRLDSPDLMLRNKLLEAINAAGYQCRPTWDLLHQLPMYSSCPRASLPTAERLQASLLNLPSSPSLSG